MLYGGAIAGEAYIFFKLTMQPSPHSDFWEYMVVYKLSTAAFGASHLLQARASRYMTLLNAALVSRSCRMQLLGEPGGSALGVGQLPACTARSSRYASAWCITKTFAQA